MGTGELTRDTPLNHGRGIILGSYRTSVRARQAYEENMERKKSLLSVQKSVIIMVCGKEFRSGIYNSVPNNKKSNLHNSRTTEN